MKELEAVIVSQALRICELEGKLRCAEEMERYWSGLYARMQRGAAQDGTV